MDQYTPGATPEVLKVLDRLVSLDLVDEVSLLEGRKGFNVFYSIDSIKLKNGVVMDEKTMMLLYNSADEVSADFIYRAVPNRGAISAVLGAKPFGEALSMGDLCAVWERAYGPVKKVVVASEAGAAGRGGWGCTWSRCGCRRCGGERCGV